MTVSAWSAISRGAPFATRRGGKPAVMPLPSRTASTRVAGLGLSERREGAGDEAAAKPHRAAIGDLGLRRLQRRGRRSLGCLPLGSAIADHDFDLAAQGVERRRQVAYLAWPLRIDKPSGLVPVLHAEQMSQIGNRH